MHVALVATVLTVSTAASASIAHTHRGAHDRVSRGQAISAARPNVHGDGAHLIAARAGRFDAFWFPGETDFARPGDYPVWAVVFGHVTAPPSCGGLPPPGVQRSCPPPQRTTEMVIIDARTGAFVESDFPAPGFAESP